LSCTEHPSWCAEVPLPQQDRGLHKNVFGGPRFE
jgi:hypothetical protein